MSYQPVRTPSYEWLSIRGLNHRIVRWGESVSRPIVLLHGFMDCADTWQFLVDCLPIQWSLVAPDWRGFGGSEWSPGGYWYPDYLADLEALLDAITPEHRACVIAHSMGANVATLYAGVRPERLQWLVNLEGIGLPRTSPDQAPGRYAQWLDEVRQPLANGRYASVEQLAGVLQRRNPRLTADRSVFVARAWTRSVATLQGGGDEPGGNGEVRLAFDPRHRWVNPVLYRREEAEACWARIQIPMLLLVGADSAHRERRLAELNDERLHASFRNLRLVTLSGLGHMMHHEDPGIVAEQIVEFVRGLQ